MGLATIAGLRSMAAPALLSRAIQRGDIAELQYTPFAALGFPKVSVVLQLMMIGEMVADKTPFVPARTSSFALAGKRRPAPGAVLGALSALPAAYAGEKLRVKGTEKLGVPGQLLGLLEDGVVLSLGTRLLRQYRT